MKRVVNLVISGVVQIGDTLAASVGQLFGQEPRSHRRGARLSRDHHRAKGEIRSADGPSSAPR